MTNKQCQYNKPGCQKIATYHHIRKLDLWEFQRNPICANCKQYIERKKASNQ